MTADWHINQGDYLRWIEQVEQPRFHRRLSGQEAFSFDHEWPLISVVMPSYNTPPVLLQAALQSVLDQLYTRWELIVVDDASSEADTLEMLRHRASMDERIRTVFRSTNGGIAAATNDGLAEARGQYIALLDHDDMLAPQALLLVARALKDHPDIRILYTDSDELDDQGKRSNPFFKPDWNYELLLGQNYLNHLTVYHAALLRNLGGLREGFDGSQDYDLALRAVERTEPERISHIAEVLYHWRVVESSVSRANLGQAVARARQAVKEHLARKGLRAEVDTPARAKIYNRIRWEPRAAVSWHLQLCPPGISGEDISAELESIDSEYICFLPQGFTAQEPQWQEVFAGLLQRPGCGLAAGSLLKPDRTLAQGPIFFNGLPQAAFSGAKAGDKAYFGRLALNQQVTTVSLAALAVSRQTLFELGGLNPYLSHPLLLGADLALRARQLGLEALWTPDVAFIADSMSDSEQLLRPPSPEEAESFTARWGRESARDNFYNPNLNTGDSSFTLPEA